MPHPSKRLLFAIESVLDIAYYGGSQPVQSGDISGRQGIPRRYLEQVLQHLVRSGILAGHRGPKGGYQLARERRRITVGEIVRPLWRDLQRKLLTELDDVTLEDLCQKAQAVGIRTDAQERLDFSI